MFLLAGLALFVVMQVDAGAQAMPAAGTTPDAGPAIGKTMAVTIDDLPGSPSGDLRALERMNVRIVRALRAARVPAIGFVNENKLQVEGERDRRTALLRRWLDAGLALGNHGFAHRDINKVPLREYLGDVLRGEVVTRALHRDRPPPFFYYRHPYTHTGPTPESKQALAQFLTDHGYRPAPFTIEHSDWVFAALYDDALARKDQRQAAVIRRQYLIHFTEMCTWFERLSQETFSRPIPQILLTHVNRLNADALPALLAHLTARGYTFVSLDEALRDPAYATADLYVGRNGPSWLHRFSVALKLPLRLKEEPDVPADLFAQWQALQARKTPPP